MNLNVTGFKLLNISIYVKSGENFIKNIRQRVREPSEKVELTTAQKPPQGASGATRRGRSARWRYPTNNQPASRNP